MVAAIVSAAGALTAAWFAWRPKQTEADSTARRNAVNGYQELTSDLGKQTDKLVAQLDRAEARIASLETSRLETEAAYHRLEAELAVTKRELAAAQQRIAQLEAERQEATEELLRERARRVALEERVAQLEAERDELRQQIGKGQERKL